MTPRTQPLAVRRLLLLAPLLLAAACASDGYDSVGEYRSEAIRPERPVPDGVAAMREDMAEQRGATQSVLDTLMGAAPAEAGYWYTPIFDAIDVAMSWAQILLP